MHDDIEFEAAYQHLSMAPEAHDAGGIARRRFLQGALALSAGLTVPLLRPRSAHAAGGVDGLGAGDGVLVVVFLGGGNDGLNTIAPISGAPRQHYDALRGGIGVPAAGLLPVGGEWGLHPKLPLLHRRYGKGRVALVEGVGLPTADLSHFTATAQSMQGGTLGKYPTGWLGRYLDALPDGASGYRAASVTSSIPLFLLGSRARVTSIPTSGFMWGRDRTPPGEAALMDAVSALGAEPTGLGGWGDNVAATGRAAVDRAAAFTPLFEPDPGADGLGRELLLAARLVNLDVGTRVIGLTIGGWDTHAAQPGVHEVRLENLDQAIEVFFANLAPRFRNRVTMLVQSEFGRRPAASAALGTDHGTAGPMLVIGENVRGGRHGAPSALDRLDDRGNLVPTVDFRSVYAEVLDSWLGADSQQILGSRPAQDLQLFAAGPGQSRA